jgi:pimeloyl-ACP methyl ester carboxylesterase
MVSSFWHFVQGPAAKRTGSRVVSYDRAGLGWSDSDPQPYDIVREVENLHKGLATLGITRDIILVGLSYGGFLAPLYASRYPEQVAGLILVEPNTTAFFASRPEIVRTIQRQAKVRRVLATLGLLRAGLMAGFGEIRVQPRGIPELETAFQISLTTRHLHAAQRALESLDAVLEQLNQGPALPAVPLTVITRGRPESAFPWGDDESEAAWRAGHEQLVRKTPGAKLLVADKSGHAVNVDQPELVIEAISNMVERTRQQR